MDNPERYRYDALNRVSSETSVGVTHQYKYDLNGNRTNAIYGITGRSVDWTYDALNRIATISTDLTNSTALTTYAYDLNSHPVYRQYPTGVEELRTFDAMGRLLTMTTTNMTSNGSFSMTYQYDAVGSAREMVQQSWALNDKAQDAVTTWEYDDRYRLTNETVCIAGVSPATNSTAYIWDDADNRLSKTVSTAGVSPATVSTVYSNNALNQMLGYIECTAGVSPATNVVEFAYDANGARTNKTVSTAGVSPATTIYTYDEDNRLTIVFNGVNITPTYVFAYDYRSRRYLRALPMVSTTLHVFDGGLSVQEYNSSPQLSSLTTEFIRGEGMGGGVGGMVYSLKHPDPSAPNQEPSIICSHANHRGDVIARSDMNGALTSFALYEAYGTRPYEWPEDGSGDPDRQKANTKEEETDLGLLNEGMRYRDLDTGTFMTRDPIGYKDGPNIYCYVHCNPITKFDALGLWSSERSRDAAGNLNIKFIVTINIIDCRSNPNARLPDQFKSGISDQVKSVVESTYSGSGKDPTTGGNVTWSIAATVSFKDSVDDVKAGDIRSSLVDNIPSPVEGYSAKGHADPGKDGKVTGGYGHRVNMSRVAEAAPGGLTASAAAQLDAIAGVITHELGHNLGLRHPGENDPNNTMPSKSNEHDPQNNGSSLGTDNVMRTGKEASGLKTDTEQAIAIDKLAQERADEDKKEDKK